MRKLLSVCVTTYNQRRYIECCLESIVTQRLPYGWDMEVLVGDDCSTDGTGDIVRAFAERHSLIVKPLARERNLGMFANYRRVHAGARGTCIAHCDGDDYWAEGKLEKQLRFLEDDPACPAVFTNAIVVADDDRRIGVFSSGIPSSFDAAFLIGRGNCLTHSSMMYRADLREAMIPASGGFIDFQLYIALLRHGRLGFLEEYLTCYRSHNQSSVTLTSRELIRQLYWQALSTVGPNDAPASSRAAAKANFLAGIAQRELNGGDLRKVREWAAVVLRSAPGQQAGLLIGVGLSLCRSLSAAVGRRLLRRAGLQKAQDRVFHPR
ncbi:MAG: glycosyltransferase [Proteobacteria bacterium]|nr:glycosyltransferase [Pseudomonadota bacterium]